MNNIFPFVQLKSFQNGWRYSGKLKEFIKHKYYGSLVKINDSSIYDISEYLHGTVLTSKIFKNFAWVLYLNPVPNIQIYIFCERNSKSGDNFSIFFGKECEEIPVEDIYGFALIYITLLALIGADETLIRKSAFSDKFVFFDTDKKEYAGLIRKQCLASELSTDKILRKIKKFNSITDYNLSKNKVELVVHPLKSIKFKFIYNNDKREIFILKDSLDFFSSKLIISFTGLICNAIRREFKK
jgi:hypothetical protein